MERSLAVMWGQFIFECCVAILGAKFVGFDD